MTSEELKNNEAKAAVKMHSQTAQSQSQVFFGEQMENGMAKGEVERKFQEFLKAIKEQTYQLGECLQTEKRLLLEFCLLLKQVLKQFNLHFSIPPTAISQSGRIKQVILNEEAHLIIVNDKNEIFSKELENYPPHVVLNVAWTVMPELNKSLVSHREKISRRLTFFERINQELRSLFKVFETEKKKSDAQCVTSTSRSSEEENSQPLVEEEKVQS